MRMLLHPVQMCGIFGELPLPAFLPEKSRDPSYSGIGQHPSVRKHIRAGHPTHTPQLPRTQPRLQFTLTLTSHSLRPTLEIQPASQAVPITSKSSLDTLWESSLLLSYISTCIVINIQPKLFRKERSSFWCRVSGVHSLRMSGSTDWFSCLVR